LKSCADRRIVLTSVRWMLASAVLLRLAGCPPLFSGQREELREHAVGFEPVRVRL